MKLSPPHGLSQSHICSPKGLCPNDYQSGWEKGGGVKTPGEKPFALEMWGCVIISTAATRSRTETAGSRPARLQAQNICRVGNKMCRGPSLSRHQASLPRHSPPSPKRGGRQNHRGWGGLHHACARRRHKEGVPAPAKEAWLQTGTEAGCISKSCDPRGPQCLRPGPGNNFRFGKMKFSSVRF